MSYSEEDLWNMMRFLYHDVTLKDFEETLELEGFQDTETRLIINLRNRLEMIEQYGGDGKSRLREKFSQFKEGSLGKKKVLTDGQKSILNQFLKENK